VFLSAFLGILLAVTTHASTADWPLKGLPDEAQLAWQTLRSVDVFAFGPVGFAGETSEGELAMRILLRYPNAVSIFQLVASQSTPEGRLYALVALRSIDHDAYREALTKLTRNQKISLQATCVRGKESVSAIIANLEAGKYDPFIPKPAK